MWIEKEVTIDKKKINCLVNGNQVEVPFYDGISTDLDKISINSELYKVLSLVNVADRDETILITIEVNNESESNKSRKTSKLSK